MGDAEQSLSDLGATTRALHHIPAGLIGTGFMVHHEMRSWLVTASAVADSATLLIAGPDQDRIVLRKQRKLWSTLPRGGVAVMPLVGDHQAIDLGTAATADLPGSAQVLGYDGLDDAHAAGTASELPLITTSDGLAIGCGLPFGYVGGPVLVRLSEGDEVICVGLALPGGDRHPVATLAVVRATIEHASG